jgi:hypothetical protein
MEWRHGMLRAFHNGEEENLLYLPDYKMYLAIDFDGVNVYDAYENFYGNYPTEEEAIEAIKENRKYGCNAPAGSSDY